MRSFACAAQMKSVENDGCGALHPAKKNRMHSSFSRQEMDWVGEWERRGRSIDLFLPPHSLEQNQVAMRSWIKRFHVACEVKYHLTHNQDTVQAMAPILLSAVY